MPYTQEELQKLSFYQNLINEDEQQYLQKRATLSRMAAVSGSANDGNLLLRDKSNAILLFEDPYKNELLEDDSSKIIHNLRVKKLKTTDQLDEVLQRDISSSTFEMVVDEIASGLDPSASNYIVSSSYPNGTLVRSGGRTQ